MLAGLLTTLLLGMVVVFVISKAVKLSRHAGEATGPLLSILNFVQSADVFQGLNLHWPQFFKVLCRSIASLFNSLNIFAIVMNWVYLPTPQCVFDFTFVQKWYLIMLSPVILAVVCMVGTFLYVLLWKAVGVRLAYASAARCLGRICSRQQTEATQRLTQRFEDFRSSGLQAHLLEPEPEPEPEHLPEPVPAARERNALSLQSDHENFGSSWQYRSWSHGAGKWKSFGPQEQQQLDDAAGRSHRTATIRRGRVEYQVDLMTMHRVDSVTGRRTKIRRIERSSKCLCCVEFAMHDWTATMHGIARIIVIYLTVGYTFLTGTALEPIVCQQDLDGSLWVGAAPSLECNWCSADSIDASRSNVHTDNITDASISIISDVHVSYSTLATFAIVAFTLYGFCTPLLLAAIMWYNRGRFQTDKFRNSFGFLTNRMRAEYFWWEIMIMFRKCCFVVITKFSDGYRLPCSMLNLLVAFAACLIQLQCSPFAAKDANIAEVLTIVATVLVLALGLAQKSTAAEEYDGGISEETVGSFISNFNTCICTHIPCCARCPLLSKPVLISCT
jgi:hypothetical protein